MNNTIYFPLRSNVGWFQSENLKRDIFNRIKQAILIYDNLIFEDGTFTYEIFNDGSAGFYLLPGNLPNNQRIIEYGRDIKKTDGRIGVQINGSNKVTQLMGGLTKERFKIDYFELLNQIDLSQNTFIKYGCIKDSIFTPEIKKEINTSISRDKHDLKVEFENTDIRDFVVKNLNTDLITSNILNASMNIDIKHKNLLQLKLDRLNIELSKVTNKTEFAVRKFFDFASPDFDKISIIEVLKLRNDDTWIAFREFVSKLMIEFSADFELQNNNENFNDFLHTKIDRILFKELRNRYQSGKKTTIEVGAGLISLIPIYGQGVTVIDAAMSIKDYFSDKKNWLAFLMKLDNY